MCGEKDKPCCWLQVESGKNKLFRNVIYVFVSMLIFIAGYGLHLNYSTSQNVAALQESSQIIKELMFNFFDKNSSLAELADKEFKGEQDG